MFAKLKNVFKLVVRAFVRKIIIIVLIGITVVSLFASFVYFLNIDESIFKDGDLTNTPYAASLYTSNLSLGDDGQINTSVTARELWKKMRKAGNDVDKYLDGPEELLKLMNAGIATEFLDTRSDPDEPIDVEELNSDIDSNDLQGIVKLKRETDGNEATTMTYVEPSEFQEYINEYNESGTEEAKEEALSHYTIEVKTGSSGSATQFLAEVKKVYEWANELANQSPKLSKMRYGCSTVLPPCEDGYISCDRLIARALYNMGYTDQPTGGMSCGMADDYLTSHGFTKITDQNDLQPGDVVAVGHGSSVAHMFVINSYDQSTGACTTYDMGCDNWLLSEQPLQSTMTAYTSGRSGGAREFIAAYRLKGKARSSSSSSSSSSSRSSSSGNEERMDFVVKTDEPNPATIVLSRDVLEEGLMQWTSGRMQENALEILDKVLEIQEEYQINAIFTYALLKTESSIGTANTSWVRENNWTSLTALGHIQYESPQANLQAFVEKTLCGSYYFKQGRTSVYSIGEIYCADPPPPGWADVVSSFMIDLYNACGITNYNGQVIGGTTSKKSTYYVKVATWNENIKEVVTDDPEKTSYIEVDSYLSTEKIDVRELVSGYSMPFDYLWTLLVISDDKKFVFDLIDLIYDSDIEVTIHDNLQVSSNSKTETREVNEEVTYDDGSVGTVTYTYTTTTTITTEKNKLETGVTYADTWCVEYKREYDYSESEDGSKRYSGSTPEIREKTERNPEDKDEKNFVTVLCSKRCKNAYDNIKSVAEWLFEALETNDNTKDMVDLTKYLLYKTYDKSYGVKSFDFDEYVTRNMVSKKSSMDLFKQYLHYWEGTPGISDDGEKYLIGLDKKGVTTVGYGIHITTCGYYKEFKEAGYDLNVGSYIDKKFVDEIEDKIINDYIEKIEEKFEDYELKPYQKFALVSRMYDCGREGAFAKKNLLTFEEAYNLYWDEEEDDEYGEPKRDDMFNHKLYKVYMSYPIYSGTMKLDISNLTNRRQSEWILFKTGYFDVVQQFCDEKSMGSNDIVEMAIKCHAYLRENRYTYAQAGINIPIRGGSTVDCSSFVSWVLYEAGYEGFEGYQKTSYVFNSNPWGWQEVSLSDAQPGDILCYNGHVEIFAGMDGGRVVVYNCGSNSSIWAEGINSDMPETSYSGSGSGITKILRPPSL